MKRTEQVAALLLRAQELLEEAPFPAPTPAADRTPEALEAGTKVADVIGRVDGLRSAVEALVPHEVTGPDGYARNRRNGRSTIVVVDEEGKIHYAA